VVTSHDGENSLIHTLLESGAVDSTYKRPGVGSIAAFDTVPGAGEVVVIRDFFAGRIRHSIEKYDTNGERDSTFRPRPIGSDSSHLSTIKVIGNQVYVAVGPVIKRLNLNDGSEDDTFIAEHDLGNIHSLSVEQNGDVVVGGSPRGVTPYLDYVLLKLKENGNAKSEFSDLSFDFGEEELGGGFTALPLSDGRIFVGGNFNKVNNRATLGMGFVKSDGQLDESSTTGVGVPLSDVTAIETLADDSVLVAGNFSVAGRDIAESAGPYRRNLARLLPDGSLDRSFDAGTGAQGSIHSISLQSTGKIIVLGEFATFNDSSYSNLVQRGGSKW